MLVFVLGLTMLANSCAGSCILDLELITQDFSSEEEAGLYPINAARNRALMLARSDVRMPRIP